MTSIAREGVGNRMRDGQETVKAARKHVLTQAPGTLGDLGSSESGLKTQKI